MVHAQIYMNDYDNKSLLTQGPVCTNGRSVQAFRLHYCAARFHRKRIDLKTLLKVDQNENAYKSY